MKLTILASLLLSVLVLAGCQTIEGAGQDLSAAGTAIAQESRAVQSGL